MDGNAENPILCASSFPSSALGKKGSRTTVLHRQAVCSKLALFTVAPSLMNPYQLWNLENIGESQISCVNKAPI
jgi:hypothetical protein